LFANVFFGVLIFYDAMLPLVHVVQYCKTKLQKPLAAPVSTSPWSHLV